MWQVSLRYVPVALIRLGHFQEINYFSYKTYHKMTRMQSRTDQRDAF
jgi:hypothetical protein